MSPEIKEIFYIGLGLFILAITLYIVLDKKLNRCTKCGTKMVYDDYEVFGRDIVATKKCPKCDK